MSAAPGSNGRSRVLARLVAGILAIFLALAAVAQTTSASLSGVVRTASGQPVVGAVVQARSESTGVVRSTVTDELGRYRIELLAPGTWRVEVRAGGVEPRPSEIVQLSLQETRQLDFVAQDALTETVRVVADAPLIDTTRTTGELRVGGTTAETLPVSGRVISDLALLDSSVTAAPPGNYYGERGAVFTVNGQSGRSNTFLVDGMDNNDQTSGTGLNGFFSQLVIQEFVVMTHQFAPEFGRASGGVLNIVTRQGGNEFEGEVFAQGTSSSWNSQGELVKRLPDSGVAQSAAERFQSGFWVGGPFKEDRAFYFVAFEHQQGDAIVPFSALQRDGTFGGRYVAPSRGDSLFFRTDYVLSPSQFLMVRLSADDRSNEGINVGGVRAPDSGSRIDERDVQFAATLTSIASPTLFNELRLLVGNSSLEQRANSSLSGVTRPSGIFGGNELNSQFRDERRIQLVENLTWLRGNHTFKFGIDITRSSTDIRTAFNPNGSFIYRTDAPFEPGDCGDLIASQVINRDGTVNTGPIDCPGRVGEDDDGDGVIDEPGFINTYPLVFTLVDGEPADTFEDTRYALFAQDRWNVTPRLQLDYGLRYDLSTYRLPRDVRVDAAIPNGGADRDTDNVAPRFGFTFTPKADNKFVIRGGAGIFYDKLVLGFPAVAAITSQTAIGFTFPQGLTVELTEDAVEEFGIDLIKQVLVFPDELTLRFSTGTELKTPYTVQYNLGFERALGARGALRVDAVHALGYHMPIFRDLNPVADLNPSCPQDKLSDCLGIPVHRDPTTGSIAAIVSEGRSWYDALDVGYRWQGDESWLSASYTWSRAEDLGFDPLKDGVSLPPDSDNVLTERGRADGDRRHRLVLSGEAGLPFDMRASAVIQLATGTPFNVVTGVDHNLDGFLNDRPDGVGRNTGEDTPLAPVNDVRVANGLAPVSGLSEPNFAQVDLRVWRPFVYGGRDKAGQLYLQVFNLLDRSNGGMVDGRALSASFGRVIGQASPPRTLEFGLKLGF